MQKIVAGLLIACVFKAVLFSQHIYPKLPLETNSMREYSKRLVAGGVKLKRDSEYLLMEGKITSEKHVLRNIEYDKWGRVKEIAHTDKAGKTTSIDIYEYLPNAMLRKIVSYHPTGTILGHVDLKYDEQGFLLEEVEYDRYDHVLNKVLYQVYHNDTTLTENYFDASQELKRTVKKHYSDFYIGRLTSVEEYKPDRVMLYRKDILYENGKEYREMYYDSTGELKYYLEYEYNPHGKLFKIVKYYPGGGKFTHYTCQFNEQGFLDAEIKYVKDQRVSSYYRYTYH